MEHEMQAERGNQYAFSPQQPRGFLTPVSWWHDTTLSLRKSDLAAKNKIKVQKGYTYFQRSTWTFRGPSHSKPCTPLWRLACVSVNYILYYLNILSMCFFCNVNYTLIVFSFHFYHELRSDNCVASADSILLVPWKSLLGWLSVSISPTTQET